MKKKTGMYLAIGIIGIALALIAKFLLQDYLSDSQSGAMIGIGAGLFGYGIAKWCVALWGAKNPDLMKINEIEEKDERNKHNIIEHRRRREPRSGFLQPFRGGKGGNSCREQEKA